MARVGKRYAVLALSAAAVAVAACGSSSKAPASPSATPSTPTTTSTASAQSSISGNGLGKLPTVHAGSGPVPSSASEVDQAFLRMVFDDVQRVWSEEFKAAGLSYTPAKLVFFTSGVNTPCGMPKKDEGPLYCGADGTVYLDVGFLNQFAKIGGFAQAYVVGHEFGHHVQDQLGINQRVHAANQANPKGKNAVSVREELQADCLAGVWAHAAYSGGEQTASILEEKLQAANILGDDFEARNGGTPADPGLFTHGSSAQRQHWLKTGFESGDPRACDTFSSLRARP